MQNAGEGLAADEPEMASWEFDSIQADDKSQRGTRVREIQELPVEPHTRMREEHAPVEAVATHMLRPDDVNR